MHSCLPHLTAGSHHPRVKAGVPKGSSLIVSEGLQPQVFRAQLSFSLIRQDMCISYGVISSHMPTPTDSTSIRPVDIFWGPFLAARELVSVVPI